MSISEKFTAGEIRELEDLFFETLRRNFVVVDKTKVYFFLGGAVVLFLSAGVAGWFEAKQVAAKAVADVAGSETIALLDRAKAKANDILSQSELVVERIVITKTVDGQRVNVMELGSDNLGGRLTVHNNAGNVTTLVHHHGGSNGGSINAMGGNGEFGIAMHVVESGAGEIQKNR